MAGGSQSELSEAMFEALNWDNAAEASRLIDLGWRYGPLADPHRKAAEGSGGERALWSPMVFAAFEASASCFPALLAHGGRVDESTAEGLEPLHFAAQASDPEGVAVLLAAGANPMARSIKGETPLHRAIFSGCQAGVALLLAAGADPNALTEAGVSPLESAAREADAELILALLNGGADPWRSRSGSEEPIASLLRRQSQRWGSGLAAEVIGKMEAMRESSELSAHLPRGSAIAPGRGGAI